MFPRRNTRLRVINLQLQRTGTYSSQYLRPYHIPTEGRALDMISNKVHDIVNRVNDVTAHNPLQQVDSRLLSGLASHLIQPLATPERKIVIPNGWDTPRLRFIMQVELDHGSRNLGTTTYFFQGYTEHGDLSYTNEIDDRMLFFINSYIEVVQHTDPITYSTVNKVVSSGHMVDGRMQVQNANGHGALYGLRPYDIYAGLQSNTTMSALSFEGDTYYDSMSDLSKGAFTSRRSNNVPSMYLADIINKRRSAAATADIGYSNDSIHGRSMQAAYENGPYENPFIRALSDMSGRPSAQISFTLGDLMQLDPDMPNPKYSEVRNPELLSRAGQDEWDRPDIETQLASVIANAVAAIMSDCMLVAASFVMHNHTHDGMPDVRPLGDPISVTGDRGAQNMALFFHRLETELWFDLCPDHGYGLYIRMHANANFDSRLTIQVESNPEVDYNIPSFCDAMLLPTMTMDTRNYNQLTDGLETLIESVTPTAEGSALVANINYDV